MAGYSCSATDCGYTTTTQVPDDVDIAIKVQLMQLQMQELQAHVSTAHPAGGGAVQVKKQTIKMKPMDHPEFDGIAKNYARLKQDYYCMKWSIDDRLEECWRLWGTALSKEQYEELTAEVEELSDLLLVQLKVVCNDLVKALPQQDADKLKGWA